MPGAPEKEVPKAKRQKVEKFSTPSSRSSLRLRGLAPDGTTVSLTVPQTAEEVEEEREMRVGEGHCEP